MSFSDLNFNITGMYAFVVSPDAFHGEIIYQYASRTIYLDAEQFSKGDSVLKVMSNTSPENIDYEDIMGYFNRIFDIFTN